MSRAEATEVQTDMRDDYDFSEGVRGKYASRLAEGSKVVVIDPDVAEEFPDADAVNEALRTLMTPKR